MKIVCLLGSPRTKGNSAALAQQFCQTVMELGGDVETFVLNKMTYRGCQGCMMCKTKLEKCAVKDDLETVLDSVRDADILVMATPTYYGEVSSQMKGFIDRTFSYLKPDYMTNSIPSRLQGGKQLVFIQTQAQPDENQFADVFPWCFKRSWLNIAYVLRVFHADHLVDQFGGGEGGVGIVVPVGQFDHIETNDRLCAENNIE